MSNAPCKRFRIINGKIVWSKTYAKWNEAQNKKLVKRVMA